MEISLVFVNKEFGKIRVAEHNGAAWFVGSDVCDCLEIGNSRDAVASLQDDEKGVAFIDTLGHDQEISTISESGLYSLVFRSSKPEAANAFRQWSVHKVLPTIRKTGCHGTPQAEDEILSRAIAIAANRIGLLSQEVAMLQEQIALDAPKVELAEAIMKTKECVSVNQFAKILKQNGLDMDASRVYRELYKAGYLIRQKGANWMPKPCMMDKGYFRVVERSTDTGDDYQFVTVTTLLTGIGQCHLLAHFLNKYGARRQEGRVRA